MIIDTLVLSGASTKASTFAGVFRALFKQNVITPSLEGINHIICCSISMLLSVYLLLEIDISIIERCLMEGKFENILNEHKSQSNYDCIIPVSGGKDSYYQAHQIVEEFKLKPLLVTYDGNNYLPEGIYNRDKMRENFDADHLIFGPSVKSLRELNIQCFKIMGDMNWHAHCGIYTYPFQVAVKFKIPLLIWGETFWDISGM